MLTWGLLVGIALGPVATTVLPRWGRWWFTISLSAVVGVMMLTYVSVPARLIGVKTTTVSRQATSSPPRSSAEQWVRWSGRPLCPRPCGILMLGSRILFIPGIVLLTLGLTLQAGTDTGAVKAIKIDREARRGPSRRRRHPATRTGPSLTAEFPGRH